MDLSFAPNARPGTANRIPYTLGTLPRRLLGRWLRAGIVGHIDGMRAGRLHGWAADLLEPERRLEIRLEAPERASIMTLADRYRADLQARGLGDGCHGFAFAVPTAADPAAMRVVAGPARVPLNAVRGQRLRQTMHDDGPAIVCLDGREPRRGLSGWAIDRDRPPQRCLLRLRSLGGEHAEEQRATLWRADIPASDDTDRLHGFAFRPVPPPAAGRFVLEDVRTGRVLVRFG